MLLLQVFRHFHHFLCCISKHTFKQKTGTCSKSIFNIYTNIYQIGMIFFTEIMKSVGRKWMASKQNERIIYISEGNEKQLNNR